jgi:hypothetical protein
MVTGVQTCALPIFLFHTLSLENGVFFKKGAVDP